MTNNYIDTFNSKNLFNRTNQNKGLMIKCSSSNSHQFNYYVYEFIVKVLPDYLSYSVCEEREYFEIYVPVSIIKKYKHDLYNLLRGEEIVGIVNKIQGIRVKKNLTPYLYEKASNQMSWGRSCIRKFKNL